MFAMCLVAVITVAFSSLCIWTFSHVVCSRTAWWRTRLVLVGRWRTGLWEGKWLSSGHSLQNQCLNPESQCHMDITATVSMLLQPLGSTVTWSRARRCCHGGHRSPPFIQLTFQKNCNLPAEYTYRKNAFPWGGSLSVVKYPIFGIRSNVKLALCPWPSMWPWASSLVSTRFGFFLYKMWITVAPTSSKVDGIMQTYRSPESMLTGIIVFYPPILHQPC